MVIFKNLPQSPVTSHQSPVTSHQSPVTSHQSPVTSHLILNCAIRHYSFTHICTHDICATHFCFE
ncbi:MAG: hypothetical protein ACKPBB_18780, partial [Sphaerospermopsis kisseleviana]